MFDLPPPEFERVVLDAQVEIGYGVALADVDGDGLDDVLLVDAREVRWYRAPDWRRFVLCGRLSARDHVAIAARDLDGDGKAEVAVAADWDPADRAASGALSWLEPGDDRTQPWTPHALPAAPTLHRLAFVRHPGAHDGDASLIGMPLHGRDDAGARLLALAVPARRDLPAQWSAAEGRLGFRLAHGLAVGDRDGDGVEELLVASAEGVTPLVRLGAGDFAGDWGGRPITAAGAGEVAAGRFADGRRFLATIEPFHGHELAVHVEPERAGEPWLRRTLDATLAEGHALACGDLLARGDTQIVAGWRRPDARGRTGIRLFVPTGAADGELGPFAESAAFELDGAIACESLALGDLDRDGRLDVAAAGRATHDLVLLLNRGPLPPAAPRAPAASRAPLDVAALRAIEAPLHEAIARGELPGAVVAVGRSDGLHFLRAAGARTLVPAREPMGLETLFDLASLTKPIATAFGVMALVDDGRLALDDRLVDVLPEARAPACAEGDERLNQRFAWKNALTLRDCLLHVAGFVPDNELADYADGPVRAWERLLAQLPEHAPGERFVYSDVGYLLLGRAVEQASGLPLERFVRQRLFAPLAMHETGYLPDARRLARAAPHQVEGDGATPPGRVHDPRAAALDGVAGHAGLFSTALDLARFARMVLNGGELDGVRVLSPEAVAQWTTPQRAADAPLRTPGFDVRSRFSSNRGEGMSARAFGHGGFTGTALWIDPGLDLFVVFLSHRLHPDGSGRVNPLIGRIGSIAAAAVGRPRSEEERALAERERIASERDLAALAGQDPPDSFAVRTGADLVAATAGGRLRGRRIGLVTHHCGVTSDGTPLHELFADPAHGVTLVRLFSPEHGFLGVEDAAVADARTAQGLEIVSLYGERRRPAREQLADLDTLVIDLQDAGARCYTYAATLVGCLEAAAECGVRVVVLDRPNPIGGLAIGGPLPDSGRTAFTCFHPVPMRHGMTLGELARLVDAERGLRLDLEVIGLAGWERAQFFDQTLLPWRDPSPNLRTLDAALLYPGLVLFEPTNVSVGRGTDLPFEQIGAPWLDARAAVGRLAQRPIPGVAFLPVEFTPAGSVHAGERCGGVRVDVVRRELVDPFEVALELAAALRAAHGDRFELAKMDALLCDRAALDALASGADPQEILAGWRRAAAAFAQRRRPFLLER